MFIFPFDYGRSEYIEESDAYIRRRASTIPSEGGAITPSLSAPNPPSPSSSKSTSSHWLAPSGLADSS
ncbi:MAG: hypothetical protein WBC73_04650, partial [Phormidesmis sp.]